MGEALMSVLPHLVGSQVDDLFHIQKPLIDFQWETVGLGFYYFVHVPDINILLDCLQT